MSYSRFESKSSILLRVNARHDALYDMLSLRAASGGSIRVVSAKADRTRSGVQQVQQPLKLLLWGKVQSECGSSEVK